MTYHSQLNLIMLVTIIGLAVFLYLTPQFQPESDAVFQVSLRDPDTVKIIRIIRHDEEIILQRLEGRWYLSSPYHARADEVSVGKILNILSANSRQRYPLTSREEFNLDNPLIEVYLDDDYFAFGGLAPTTNEQYLIINQHVYLVSPQYAIWIPVKPLDIVSMQLLDEKEMPVKFEFRDFLMKHEDAQVDEWRVNGHMGEHLTAELLNRWVQLWHSSQASELIVDQHKRSAAYPVARLTFQNGKIIQLSALEDGNGSIIFRNDEQVGYFFPDPKNRQLLDFYGSE
jgi:hypothetical protein